MVARPHCCRWLVAVGSAASLLLSGMTPLHAGDAPPRTENARQRAPIDLTGYWVSLITEDWRYRMVTPPRGEAVNVPITPEGRKLTQAYDPDRDEQAGEQCRAYGAPGIMRMPTRLHITWQDDNTIKIETDTGRQTRLLHFNGTAATAATTAPSWQGYSQAAWEDSNVRLRGFAVGSLNQSPPSPPRNGSLRAITTRLRPGYLRTNGVPYSENAVLTEYFDRHTSMGVDYITHTRIVADPVYLSEPYVVTSHFRKEPNGSKWSPTDCIVGRPFK